MTYAPDSLTDLGTFWSHHGGTFLGIIGNQKHCSGYHLGSDRIMSNCACKPDGTCEPGQRWSDYSVKDARDKAGLTNAASAIDLGRLNGSLPELYRFSRWLVARCIGGAPGAKDVREIIYSPDGNRVQRWSGVDGQIHTGPGNGDSSHTMHTHISYFRDSEKRDKTALFAPFFALPDTSEEPEMETIVSPVPRATGHVTSAVVVTLVTADGKTRKNDKLTAVKADDQLYAITRDGTAVPGVLRRLAEAPYAGYYVDSGVVEYTAPEAPAPDCDAAIDAALDHLVGPVQNLLTAIEEARPR